MPDPSHRPYKPMTIIRPHTKPPLWWLFPWSYARTLHMAANALRAMTDRQDQALTLQAHIIADQSEEIDNLRRRVDDLSKPLEWLPIARLKAEVERLKADNEQLQNRCDFLEDSES